MELLAISSSFVKASNVIIFSDVSDDIVASMSRTGFIGGRETTDLVTMRE